MYQNGKVIKKRKVETQKNCKKNGKFEKEKRRNVDKWKSKKR